MDKKRLTEINECRDRIAGLENIMNNRVSRIYFEYENGKGISITKKDISKELLHVINRTLAEYEIEFKKM